MIKKKVYTELCYYMENSILVAMDAAILSVPVCGEDVEVMERFNYLGSDIRVSAG